MYVLALPLFWQQIHAYAGAISIHPILLQLLSSSFLVAIYHSLHHPNCVCILFVCFFIHLIDDFVRSFIRFCIFRLILYMNSFVYGFVLCVCG